ncbi:MAG: multicopper oxidase domain-containing protein [Alphaproteobacteria bacterium]|nr:multicopper oxidase domain-containing protein [Alphaproteobacteria bacterium]
MQDGVHHSEVRARRFRRLCADIGAARAVPFLAVLGAGLILLGASSQAQTFDTVARLLESRLADIVPPGYAIDGHQAGDGAQLVAQAGPHADAPLGGAACARGAETKLYEFAAIRTQINLDRWGDHDPEGFMFASPQDIPAIQASARTGRAANFGISLGLGDDPIQPLTLRVNVGDCLRLVLFNRLDRPTSFHVHGADLVIAETGEPALSTNPDAMALPGATVVYQWYVDPTYYRENTHYAHPHGPAARFQVSHGLFAAVIVEPAGSEYFDPRSGLPLCEDPVAGTPRKCANSWDAMISPGEGEDFREFAMFYHEIGPENFVPINAGGGFMPQFDPVSGTYKPAGRAINYRSEPFLRRLREAAEQVDFYRDWHPDEALAYSSYTYGDPATPVPQSYLGDPVKFRLLHAGSETFHVPHLHGGGIQWQRQPKMGQDQENYVPLNAGLQKQFAASMPSSSTDSQTIGPSETYDLEIGCGSGGCQQSVGDYLFHCHIASHYIAGMWHFWRVYNTKQDEAGKTDGLGPVAELPDRAGAMQHGLTSDELIGRTVEFAGRTISVD